MGKNTRSHLKSGKSKERANKKNSKQNAQNSNHSQFTTFSQLEQYVLARREMFDFDHCIQELNRFLERNINDRDRVNALDLLGEIYLDTGNSVSALACFEKSVQLDATSYTKFMNLGQLYSLEPPSAQNSQIETNKSLLCYYKGIELMKEQLRRTPQDETLKNELSMAYCAVAELFMTDLCDVPDAEHRCHDALKNADAVSPDNPHVLQDWASFLITTHKNDLAQLKLQRVVDQILACDPDQVIQIFPYDFQIATCRMLLELEKHTVAKPILEQLLAHFDECADVWYMLGHVLLQENNSNNTQAYRNCLIKAMQLSKGELFEKEIQTELTEKFGANYMQGIDVKTVDEVLDKEGEEDEMVDDEDDANWSDVDSDEGM
jgi:tetratricopeptide (TPR) repeat protein